MAIALILLHLSTINLERKNGASMTQGFNLFCPSLPAGSFLLANMCKNVYKEQGRSVLCLLSMKTFILCLDYGAQFVSRQTKHNKRRTGNWSNPELRQGEAERNQLGDGSH